MPGFETQEGWTEIRYRLADPGVCSKQYGRKTIAKGVSLIVCKKKDGSGWMNQALRFAKSVFPTIPDAKAWFTSHWKKSDQQVWGMFMKGEYSDCDVKAIGFEDFVEAEDSAKMFEELVGGELIFNGEPVWNMTIADPSGGYEAITLSDDSNSLEFVLSAKEIQRFKCDAYSCLEKEESGREVLYAHATAVTLSKSNDHRFPEDVLARDIHTLEDKPVVDWHSKWPEEKLSNFDIIGRVVKAWYNKAKKRAEVKVKIWNKSIIEVMKERKKNGKPLIAGWSVGFRHKFKKEKDGTHVSTEVKFHHLGFLIESDIADGSALTLPMDEALLADIGKAEDTTVFEEKWKAEMVTFLGLKQTYDCECIECGHKVKSEEHCIDIDCPECGGTMRRVGRPSVGQPKSESTAKSDAGSSTDVEAKYMTDKTADELKVELEAQAKELKEMKAKAEEEAKQLKEKSDALDAALKEKEDAMKATEEAATAQAEAEKASKEAEVLLQKVEEEKLAGKVDSLVESGQVAEAKRDEVLTLLKATDEDGQKALLDILETKAKDVPHDEEAGSQGASDDSTSDGAELMSDEKANEWAMKVHGVPYQELVTGQKAKATTGGES